MSLDTALEVGRLYAPIKQIADMLSQAQVDTFVQLPGLRGYWPMSAVNSSGAAVDLGNASVNLLRQGSPLFSYDGNAYIQLGVANDYLSTSLSDLNITGTEAWIDPSIRGLTIGGWFWVDDATVDPRGLISKFGASPQYGFSLTWTEVNQPRFMISGNGTTVALVNYSVRLVSTWYFIVGRFTPSTEVAIFVNDDKVINTTTIPASINVSTQSFEVGRYFNNNDNIVEGRARDVFVCTAALPDSLIEKIREASAP